MRDATTMPSVEADRLNRLLQRGFLARVCNR